MAAIGGAPLLVGGCASNRSAEPDAASAITSTEEAEAPIDPAYLAGPPMDVATGDTPAPVRAEALGQDATDAEDGAFWREDGRPVWWLAEARHTDGRVIVTVEALGSDLGDARARALEAGRSELRRHAGPAPGGERVEALLVKRVEGDSPGRARYVGYARLSAREPDSLGR